MPHYSYCSSAILQIFLCCVYFGNCCQMLTIWTLSSFLKAALSFCLEDACMPGSHDVRNCIVTWETWPAPLKWWGAERGSERGFGFALPSPGTTTSDAARVCWFLAAASPCCWSLKVPYRGESNIGERWWKEWSDQLYPHQRWWGLKQTWEGEPGVSA